MREGKDARSLPGARRALVPEMMRSIDAKIIAWFESFYALGEASERRKEEQDAAYREDEVGHVTITGDDLEAGNGVAVADDVRNFGRAILLDPGHIVQV